MKVVADLRVLGTPFEAKLEEILTLLYLGCQRPFVRVSRFSLYLTPSIAVALKNPWHPGYPFVEREGKIFKDFPLPSMGQAMLAPSLKPHPHPP